MKQLTYLAILEPTESHTYSLFFPEVPGCISTGDNLEDALKNAKAALELHYYGLKKDGDAFPEPIGNVNLDDAQGCIVAPITIYPDLIMDKFNNKKVKTNCVLPAWLKELAEKHQVNYSQVLEQALKEKFGINQ